MTREQEGTPAPEPAARGLAPEQASALGAVVYQFRVALSNLSLYQPGSQQALKASSGMYDPLARLLEEVKTLDLGDAGDALVANGAELQLAGPNKTAGDFLKETLRQAGVKAVTVKVGLTLDELYRFLDVFHQRRISREAAPALSQETLNAAGIQHISLSERVYVSVSDRDVVLEGAKNQLGQGGRAVDEVMKHVERIMDLTAVDDAAVRDQVRLEVAKQLLSADPEIAARLEQRVAAALALGVYLERPEVRQALEPLVRDADPDLRAAASAAFGIKGG